MSKIIAPLPMIDGISPSAVCLPAGNWSSIYAFLSAHFAHISPETWQTRIAQGLVLDAQHHAINLQTPYQAGQTIYYYRHVAQEPEIPFKEHIIFEDDVLLVADKPHFLPVIPTGTYVQHCLLTRLKKTTGLAALTPLHRIDKDTAGIVMFCKKPALRAAYAQLFANHEIDKTYHAIANITAPLVTLSLNQPFFYESRLVRGEPFYITQQINGAGNNNNNSKSQIQLIQQLNNDLGLFALKPISGKKHQLRVHMASLNMPILNDPLYPQIQQTHAANFERPLQLLAKQLAFIDPISKKPRLFASKQQLTLST